MAENPVCRIILQPTHSEITVVRGTPLRDVLFEQGVEFPCGGRGRCRGCRVRVLRGPAPIHAAEKEVLSVAEISQGWRLACQCSVDSDLEIELRQWDAVILADESQFAFRPREGLGVAVDLGTTTLVAQLVDLQTGRVLGVKTALNAQARQGADVMSRVHFAVLEHGQPRLERLIREQIGRVDPATHGGGWILGRRDSRCRSGRQYSYASSLLRSRCRAALALSF